MKLGETLYLVNVVCGEETQRAFRKYVVTAAAIAKIIFKKWNTPLDESALDKLRESRNVAMAAVRKELGIEE